MEISLNLVPTLEMLINQKEYSGSWQEELH